ncbi:cell wall hydrolase [Candidatus Electronema sp. JM]|uniref:cell wall hydrolase n=1 Tax=Candidatus Electronema sp. JM TaxID=3401571 RepID=UPI003AA85F60
MGIAEIILWLAVNIRHEALREPFAGQVAVAQVVLNRAKACGTDVRTEITRPAQFSWTLKRGVQLTLDHRQPAQLALFSRSMEAAVTALLLPDFTGGATYFHRYDVHPSWRKEKKYVHRWGAHLFYSGHFDGCGGTNAALPPKSRKERLPPAAATKPGAKEGRIQEIRARIDARRAGESR